LIFGDGSAVQIAPVGAVGLEGFAEEGSAGHMGLKALIDIVVLLARGEGRRQVAMRWI
jgi:hypothetical protein